MSYKDASFNGVTQLMSTIKKKKDYNLQDQ